MGRLLGAWRRYWFTPAPLADLGFDRVLLAAITLYLCGTTRYLRAATVAPALWVPVPFLEALGIPQPSLPALEWMARATVVLLVAVGLGVLTRMALVLLFPLLLVQEAFLNSIGKVSHGTIPLLSAWLFFAFAPCDRAFALGATWRPARARGHEVPSGTSRYARWPIDLLFVELGAFYLAAGVSKLRAAGFAWADGYALQYYLLYKQQPAGQWLAAHLGLCAALSWLVLGFELGAPLGVVRRLRPFVLGGGLLFHVGTTWFLNVSFWPVWALYVLFVPWSRLGRALSRRVGLAQVAIALLLLAVPGAVLAGPYDATSHRSFADVESWTRVFDDPARDAWQKPKALVEALGLRAGACVADVGAGTGYMSRYLAAAVGPDGTVLAVDTEPNLVQHLRTRAEKERTPNVVPILASADNPRLPVAGVDLILILDTYHHIDDRLTYARGLRRFLRPGGRVAVVDWQKRELPVGPPLEHKLARAQVVEEMTEAGYEVAAEPDILQYQYVLVFRAR